MTTRIVAICGLKRSGKDTIADYLCAHHNFTKLKIASPLKDGLKCMFGFTDEQLETDLKDVVDERWGVKPRKVMQFFGTEVMQYQLQSLIPGIDRNFWIKRLVEEHVKCTHHRIVISDLRFQHEYEMLKQYDVTFWRVVRQYDNEQTPPLPACMHASEQEFLGIPVSHVFTNADKNELYVQVDEQILNQS